MQNFVNLINHHTVNDAKTSKLNKLHFRFRRYVSDFMFISRCITNKSILRRNLASSQDFIFSVSLFAWSYWVHNFTMRKIFVQTKPKSVPNNSNKNVMIIVMNIFLYANRSAIQTQTIPKLMKCQVDIISTDLTASNRNTVSAFRGTVLTRDIG